jgi:hypothetical protein
VAGIFNVKTFGAIGDSQMVFDGACAIGSHVVTSPIAGPFAPGDVGKIIWLTDASSGATAMPVTTITGFTDAHTVTCAAAATANAVSCALGWGTQDDTLAFVATFNASIAGMIGGDVGSGPGPGIIYMPAGGYIVSGRIYRNNFGPQSVIGPSMVGDGRTNTVLLMRPDTTIPGDGSPVLIQNIGYGARLEDFGVVGAYRNFPLALDQDLISLDQTASAVVRRLSLNFMGSLADSNAIAFRNSQLLNIEDLTVQNTSAAGSIMTAAKFELATGLVKNSIVSNFARNLAVTNNNGRSNAAAPLLWVGGTIDETFAGTSCQLFNGGQLNVEGALFFASPESAIDVDGTSALWISKSNVGRFLNPGLGGIALGIAAGGKVYSSMTTYRANAPSPISVDNVGTFIDCGGNDYANWNTGAGVPVFWRDAMTHPSQVQRF